MKVTDCCGAAPIEGTEFTDLADKVLSDSYPHTVEWCRCSRCKEMVQLIEEGDEPCLEDSTTRQ